MKEKSNLKFLINIFTQNTEFFQKHKSLSLNITAKTKLPPPPAFKKLISFSLNLNLFFLNFKATKHELRFLIYIYTYKGFTSGFVAWSLNNVAKNNTRVGLSSPSKKKTITIKDRSKIRVLFWDRGRRLTYPIRK